MLAENARAVDRPGEKDEFGKRLRLSFNSGPLGSANRHNGLAARYGPV
jgi:hypothetical protein